MILQEKKLWFNVKRFVKYKIFLQNFILFNKLLTLQKKITISQNLESWLYS